jgi:Helix-turn-helix domain
MGYKPKPRLSASERAGVARRLAAEYVDGVSIRKLAQSHSLSITLVRSLLGEQGITFRPRGGNNRASSARNELN